MLVETRSYGLFVLSCLFVIFTICDKARRERHISHVADGLNATNVVGTVGWHDSCIVLAHACMRDSKN